MIVNKQDKYSKEPLSSFAETLLNQYYTSLEVLCASAGKQADRVSDLETEQATSDYASFCNDVIRETSQCIDVRKRQLMPYIHQLAERVSDSHDCSSCTGSCKLNHGLQLTELKASIADMKKVLNKIQLASLPLYSQTIYPDEYRILRNRMALIEMNITELFFLENNYLVPKIVEAQKSIYAVGK